MVTLGNAVFREWPVTGSRETTDKSSTSLEGGGSLSYASSHLYKVVVERHTHKQSAEMTPSNLDSLVQKQILQFHKT